MRSLPTSDNSAPASRSSPQKKKNADTVDTVRAAAIAGMIQLTTRIAAG
jgi:hypothetical protein